MFIAALQRSLAVAGESEVAAMLSREPGVWSVVSIRAPQQPQLALRGAREVCRVFFADLTEYPEGPAREQAASWVDLGRIFAFADRTHPGPLLIHCAAGMSRSPAVALGCIIRALHPRHGVARAAVEILEKIRPDTSPNRLVLRLALEQFLEPDEVGRLLRQIARMIG